MKKYLLLMLILVIPLVFGQTDELFYSRSLLMDVTLASDFTLVGKTSANTEFVKAEFSFFPQDGFSQQVVSLDTYPESEKTQDSIIFYWKNPVPDKYSYSITSRLNTYNRFNSISNKITFPPGDIGQEEYLKATEKIDINDKIARQASDIVKGEDDMFMAAFKLASWTKSNINYSLTTFTAEASQKASWVLENRYGVCDELTNLFIAMARSLGMPARFVSGISYTNSDLFEEDWGLHGWAEVYFPGYGWVPFDPTYGQYGQIDATHIKLKDSLDSDKSSTRFEWKSTNADLITGTLKDNVQILEIKSKIPSKVQMSIRPLISDVGFGKYNIIEVNLKNLENAYTAFELSLAAPKEVKLISDKTKYVALRPNQQVSVYWLVKVQDELSRSYIYTFPIEALNSIGYSSRAEFNSNYRGSGYTYQESISLLSQLEEQEEKIYSKSVMINCTYPEHVFTNESFRIDCSVKNSGNTFLDNVKICLEKQCTTQSIAISQSKNATFNASVGKPGEAELIISAKNTDINKVERLKISAEDIPLLSIEDINSPEILVFGPDFKVSFSLWKHSEADPQNVTVDFYFNGKKTEWRLPEMESSHNFEIAIDKTLLETKDNSFKILVNYHDSASREYVLEEERYLPIKELNLFQKIEVFFYMLSKDIEGLFVGE